MPTPLSISMPTIIHVAYLRCPAANTGIHEKPITSCSIINATPVHCTADDTVAAGAVICSHNATAANPYSNTQTMVKANPGGADAGGGVAAYDFLNDLDVSNELDADVSCVNTISVTKMPIDAAVVLTVVMFARRGTHYQGTAGFAT